jgi:hypothetical protein
MSIMWKDVNQATTTSTSTTTTTEQDNICLFTMDEDYEKMFTDNIKEGQILTTLQNMITETITNSDTFSLYSSTINMISMGTMQYSPYDFNFSLVHHRSNESKKNENEGCDSSSFSLTDCTLVLPYSLRIKHKDEEDNEDYVSL